MQNTKTIRINNKKNIRLINYLIIFWIIVILCSLLLIFFNKEKFFTFSYLIISVCMLILSGIILNSYYKLIIFKREHFILKTLFFRSIIINYDEIIDVYPDKIITKTRKIMLINVKNRDDIINEINNRLN